MQRRLAWITAVMLAATVLCPSASAQVATLELKATGPFADPHNVTVPVNSDVELVLEIAGAQNLADWQANLTITGPARDLRMGSHDTWWESHTNVPDNTLHFQDQTSQTWILLGELFIPVVDQPDLKPEDNAWSFSSGQTETLAFLEFTCDGTGTVVVELVMNDPLLAPVLSAAAPLDGNPFTVDPLVVNSASNVSVTITQILQTDWAFSAMVAPGQEASGAVDAPDAGTYDAGTVMDVLARATDPLYKFSHWEEMTGSGVPGGGARDPNLVFPLLSDVTLVANFVIIPEPVTATLFGVGAALLGLRRRRRRRG